MDVRMYFEDHAPPHFHVYYGESHATISIETLEVLRGDLPRRSYRMVLEWAVAHRTELSRNWTRAQRHLPLDRIEPLT